MPSITDSVWPIHYPAGSAPFNPWQGHFENAASSMAALLRLYKVPVRVDDAAMRDTLFPTPDEGDKVFRADLGDVMQTYLDGAWHTAGGGYLVAARAATQSIPAATATTVIFTGATVLDEGYLGASLNSTTGVLTIEEDGQFEIRGQVTFTAGGSANSEVLHIFVNGTTVQGSVVVSNVLATLSVETIIDAEAGDLITLNVFQNSGGAKNIYTGGGYRTQLIAKRIG